MRTELITGVVLAGGASRRFGADKSTFPVNGRPMIEHVVDAVRPLVATLFVSVQRKEEAPRAVAAKLIFDRAPGIGPLAGLEAALAAAESPWVLVVACDMPSITTDALQQLLLHCSGDVSAVVALGSDGRRHPLCACYRTSLRPVVERCLRSDNRSVHGLLDEIVVKDVRLPDEVLLNVNHISDLAAPR